MSEFAVTSQSIALTNPLSNPLMQPDANVSKPAAGAPVKPGALGQGHLLAAAPSVSSLVRSWSGQITPHIPAALRQPPPPVASGLQRLFPTLVGTGARVLSVPGVPPLSTRAADSPTLQQTVQNVLTEPRLRAIENLPTDGQRVLSDSLITTSISAFSAGLLTERQLGQAIDLSIRNAQAYRTPAQPAPQGAGQTPPAPASEPTPDLQLPAVPSVAGAQPAPSGQPAADRYTAMQAAFDRPLPTGLESSLVQRWERIDGRAGQIANRLNLNGPSPLARSINEAIELPRMRLASSHYPQRVGQQSAVQAIDNWRSAEATVLNAVRSGTPITAENIKALNSVFGINQRTPVVRGVAQQFGEYRTVPMTPSSFPNREYLPPESIGRAMGDFERWYARAESSGMHPVQIAAQAYARLSSIHPFPDANGRTARLVMNWILRSHNLPSAALDPQHIDRMLDVQGSSVVPNPGSLEQELTSAIERSLDTAERILRPPPPTSRGRGFGR
jgi:Fic/DOC family